VSVSLKKIIAKWKFNNAKLAIKIFFLSLQIVNIPSTLVIAN